MDEADVGVRPGQELDDLVLEVIAIIVIGHVAVTIGVTTYLHPGLNDVSEVRVFDRAEEELVAHSAAFFSLFQHRSMMTAFHFSRNSLHHCSFWSLISSISALISWSRSHIS